jgi:apolipoprotein N-acyltransferase
VSTYYEQPIIVGIGFFVGVSSIMAAPFYMAFAACYRVLARRPGPLLSLLAAAWAAAGLGRTRLSGNPWALFGYSQMGSDRLVQIADVTGVYGVSFALVTVNAAVAELWEERHRAGRALAGIAIAGGAVALVLAYGSMRLAGAPVERRRYLVRASTAGPSAIVDPFGRVVVRTAFETRAAIAGTVWPLSGVTPYGRMGDAFPFGCGLAALAAWVARARAIVAAARPARDTRPATDAQPALDRPPVSAIGAVRPSGSSGPMVSATDWRET